MIICDHFRSTPVQPHVSRRHQLRGLFFAAPSSSNQYMRLRATPTRPQKIALSLPYPARTPDKTVNKFIASSIHSWTEVLCPPSVDRIRKIISDIRKDDKAAQKSTTNHRCTGLTIRPSCCHRLCGLLSTSKSCPIRRLFYHLR